LFLVPFERDIRWTISRNEEDKSFEISNLLITPLSNTRYLLALISRQTSGKNVDGRTDERLNNVSANKYFSFVIQFERKGTVQLSEYKSPAGRKRQIKSLKDDNQTDRCF